MNRSKLNDLYFRWLTQKVCTKKDIRLYKRLLLNLYDEYFDYILQMDGNRYEDGINLRYHFGYEMKYDDRVISSILDDRPCSMLEMMVALSMRCENQIMDDDDYGDRTGLWFWNMIKSLGLYDMYNSKFDKKYFDEVIFKFTNRTYERNGSGGLFTVNDIDKDMRDIEIWYQMFAYLNTII